MSAPKRGLPAERRMRHDRHFVDELTQRMGEGIGRMIPSDAISPNSNQPRARIDDLDDLVASIEIHGILEPLLVTRSLESPGYELVAGERRFRAAVRAGLHEVPCIELSVSPEQALEIALVENLHRRDLSAFEEAHGFETLIAKYAYTHDKVAAAVGKSRVTVTETLKLLKIRPEIRERCRHADIKAKSVLLEIARAPDAASMEALVDAIITERLDRDALRRHRQAVAEDPPDADGEQPTPEPGAANPRTRRRPFVVRFRHPDRTFSVSLAFHTDREPEAAQVIAALEQMIRDLEEDAETG